MLMDERSSADATRRGELVTQLLDLMERVAGSSPEDEWTDLLNSLELADLTKPQLVALLQLRRRDTRMSDLAAHLRMSLSSVTALVDRLGAKGLVERVQDQVDRRQVLCRLTPAGRERVEALWSSGRRQTAELAEQLSLDQLRTVVEAMGILAEAARRASDARG